MKPFRKIGISFLATTSLILTSGQISAAENVISSDSLSSYPSSNLFSSVLETDLDSRLGNTYFTETPKEYNWWKKIRVSGAIQTEFLIPYNFKGQRTGNKNKYEKDVLNNTYFDLTINAPYISIGGRFQWTKWPLPGYDKDFGGWGVPYIWATGTYKCWQLTVGDFYEQFGSGLILRIYQERTLGIDNAIRGGRFRITPVTGLKITALGGKQRRYWDYNSAWLWGLDTEWTINETCQKAFKPDYGLTLGFSYVGKYDQDMDWPVSGSVVPGADQNHLYRLNFPEKVAAFDGRIKFRAHDFNFLAEYATKNNDPNSLNNWTYRRGNVILLSGSYSNKGFSALAQAKRSQDMQFRSRRVIEADYQLSSFINHMPAFTMTQTYALAAMYPYATQEDGEWAFQADLRYLFKRGTPLGGKYGTNIRLSASYISGLEWNLPEGMTYADRLTGRIPGTNNFGAPFWKIGQLYYADLNFEFNKKVSRAFQFTLFYLFQKYNQTVIKGEGGMITANVVVGEGQWKINKTTQMRFEAQYLQTKQDKGDWLAGLLEFSFAPHWMITISDTYNCGEKENYYEVLGTYTYKANRFTFGYGKIREGFNCSGGVCKFVPETEGFKVTYNYLF